VEPLGVRCGRPVLIRRVELRPPARGDDEKVRVTTVDPRPRPNASEEARSPELSSVRSRGRIAAYVALTKPRIIELLLVTTVPTMILAADGLPSWRTVVATLIGGTLAAAGANAFNSYIDRDIDQVMHRTRTRPLATGEIQPVPALVFASLLSLSSVAWLAVTVNAASAWLTAAAIGFYVVVYTLVLKRRTAQNIVWGGAAGCMPVLIGWSAVTGGLSWTPLVLFLIIFFWTPPHYWPLAMRYKADYDTAGVPMLPVVADKVKVGQQIVLHSWAMVLSSLALWVVAPTSWFYGIAALVLGAAFLLEAHRLLRGARQGWDEARLKPMRLFHGSISYLTLLFAAMAIDPFLPL
jgi:protoheme IX farnesyltransferase